MSELKLMQHPEITELLSVLEQNGLHKEQDEVKCLAAYIDEMEGQLSTMNEELMQMHREISTIRDSSLKVRCEKLISGAEKQLWQAVTAIRTVKDNCLCMARNAMDTFKANGKAALRRAVFAMKIPSTLALLQDICGVVLSIGINLRLLAKSSAETTLPSGSETGQTLYGRHI